MLIAAGLRERPLGRLGCATSADDAAAYEATLRARRLAPTTIERYLQIVAHFAEWRPAGSSAAVDAVDAFLSTHLPGCTCARSGRRAVTENRAALRLWLRATGMAPAAPSPRTPVDAEVAAFDAYLRDVCGAALQTRVRRRRHVRAFLTELFGAQPIRYEALRPSVLTSLCRFLACDRSQDRASGVASTPRDSLSGRACRTRWRKPAANTIMPK